MSVREKIIGNVLEALRGMSEGAGYWFDWQGFYRWRAPKHLSHPCLAVLDTTEAVSLAAYPMHSRTLTVEVHAEHRVPYEITSDGQDRASEAGSWLIGDIERAMLQDVTRAGLAVDTRLVRSDKMIDYPEQPFIGCVVVFEIDYRTSLTDPSLAT